MVNPNYECSVCGTQHYKKDLILVNDEYICEMCHDNTYTTCEECGESILISDATYADGSYYCSSCADECVVDCADCGRTAHINNTTSDDYMIICDSCMSNYYYRCEDCGRLVHADDSHHVGRNIYCSSCAPSRVNIHDYGYKPDAKFYGGANLLAPFMGVELEVDNGDDSDDCAHELIKLNKPMELFYCKHDGSLDDGVEIVTHPMTLKFHMTEMKWKEIIDVCKDHRFKSHDAGTCGLHVHFSRKALGNTSSEQDVTIMKILYFYERFWNQIITFSRRKQDEVSRWAKRYGVDSGDASAASKKLFDRAARSGDRYTAVNLTNGDTVEFRIFRGTLNYVSIMATLQFCHEMVKYCMAHTILQLASSTWKDFIAEIEEYVELKSYLTQKKLITSETVVTSSVSDANEERDYDEEEEEDDDDYSGDDDDDLIYELFGSSTTA